MTRDDWTRFAGAAALILLREVEPISPAALLKARFGLTAAEIRVALAVAEGRSVREAAESFGVKPGTARAQLKSVLAKTGTHRQSELASLIARLGA